jgi:hypothetical protein
VSAPATAPWPLASAVNRVWLDGTAGLRLITSCVSRGCGARGVRRIVRNVDPARVLLPGDVCAQQAVEGRLTGYVVIVLYHQTVDIA